LKSCCRSVVVGIPPLALDGQLMEKELCMSNMKRTSSGCPWKLSAEFGRVAVAMVLDVDRLIADVGRAVGWVGVVAATSNGSALSWMISPPGEAETV